MIFLLEIGSLINKWDIKFDVLPFTHCMRCLCFTALKKKVMLIIYIDNFVLLAGYVQVPCLTISKNCRLIVDCPCKICCNVSVHIAIKKYMDPGTCVFHLNCMNTRRGIK